MHTTTEEVGNGHNAATTWDNIKMRHYMQARYKRHTHSPEDNISTWWSLVSERHSMHVTLVNKSSAVAEMGDRLAQWGWAEKGGVLYHFPWWDLGPHLTQCGLGWGLPPHQVASWSIQPFGHNTPMLQTYRTGQTMVRWHSANRFTKVRPKTVARKSSHFEHWSKIVYVPKPRHALWSEDNKLVLLSIFAHKTYQYAS